MPCGEKKNAIVSQASPFGDKRQVPSRKTFLRDFLSQGIPLKPPIRKEGYEMKGLLFLAGLLIGGAVGVVFMCLLQINRTSEARTDDPQNDGN